MSMTMNATEPDPHSFTPHRLPSGDPTLVCKRCQRWWDDEAHQAPIEPADGD